jgi:hypothetical protein
MIRDFLDISVATPEAIWYAFEQQVISRDTAYAWVRQVEGC